MPDRAFPRSLVLIALVAPVLACESESARTARLSAEWARQIRARIVAESTTQGQKIQARADSIQAWGNTLRVALQEGTITSDGVRHALYSFREDPGALAEFRLQPVLDSVRRALRAHYQPRLSAWARHLPDFHSFVAYYKRVDGNYSNSGPRGPMLTRTMRQAIDSIAHHAWTAQYWGTNAEAEKWVQYAEMGGYYVNQKFITDNVSRAVESDAAEEGARRYFANLEAEFRRNEAISARIRAQKARRTPAQHDSVRRVICAQFGDSTSSSCR